MVLHGGLGFGGYPLHGVLVSLVTLHVVGLLFYFIFYYFFYSFSCLFLAGCLIP